MRQILPYPEGVLYVFALPDIVTDYAASLTSNPSAFSSYLRRPANGNRSLVFDYE
jgi:hypothetical protein